MHAWHDHARDVLATASMSRDIPALSWGPRSTDLAASSVAASSGHIAAPGANAGAAVAHGNDTNEPRDLSGIAFPWSIAESLSVRSLTGGSLGFGAFRLNRSPFKLQGPAGGRSAHLTVEDALERRRARLDDYLRQVLARVQRIARADGAAADQGHVAPASATLKSLLYELLQLDVQALRPLAAAAAAAAASAALAAAGAATAAVRRADLADS